MKQNERKPSQTKAFYVSIRLTEGDRLVQASGFPIYYAGVARGKALERLLNDIEEFTDGLQGQCDAATAITAPTPTETPK